MKWSLRDSYYPDICLQAQILNLLMELQETLSVSFIFISHDLSVEEYISRQVAVMYLGRIVESAGRAELWRRPVHPYTQLLLASAPRISVLRAPAERRKARLPGDLPGPFDLSPGCAFFGRCPLARERCREESPALSPVSPGHWTACHFTELPSEDYVTI